jgi:hypothetical protein
VSLVDRGVYTRPYLSPDGYEVLVAVDRQSREVGHLALEPGDNPYTALAQMWDLLELADPQPISLPDIQSKVG